MLSDSDMLTLWQAMAELYGHRWQSSYGEPTQTRTDRTGETAEVLASPVQTWRKVLDGVTREELAQGIRSCAKRGEDWPPTAPQFRARCLASRSPQEAPRLPRPPQNREAGRAALREIRRVLGQS